MFGLQFISDNLGGPVIDEVIKAWKYFLNYTKNLDDLQAKMRNLGMRRDILRRRVCEANHRGEEIEADVLQWQVDTDRLTTDVEQLIQESTVRVSFMRQYQLSKQAEKKIAHAEKLTEKSNFTDISHCRPRPPELQSLSDKDNYFDLKSRTPILKDIMDALKDSNVNMIGVCGLGGVGKTTLVKELGEQMRQDGTFQQVALAIVSKDLNVKEIQSQLAGSLNFDFKFTGDEANRATKLWHKFDDGNKYLVILDDIWEKVDLRTIGIPITDGNARCKVVLTSRKKDLLRITMKADRIFSISELPEDEAWDLFKKKVGNSIESQPEIYYLARKVCRKCKGLPLAINALGAALQDKPDYAWKYALDKLERCMFTQIEGVDPSVVASLRVSYDMLQSLDAQSFFLLCCSFPEDAEIPIYKLTRHYIASSLFAQNSSRTYIEARNAVCTIIDALKEASLLTTGGHEEAVKIHDVLRAVGVSIALEKKAFLIEHGVLRWPQNPTNRPSYSAISLSFKNIRELPDRLVYPQLHTLMVDNSELSDLEVPDNFFNGMAQLTVLTFKRFRMRRLPSSLAKLTNLRMLSLNGCELADIAILKDLKSNLEVLDLQGSRIEALPPEIGQLASLRVLDIESCDKLKVIPRGVISNLPSLEELYFPKEFDAWGATINEQQDKSSRDNVSFEELKWSLTNAPLIFLNIHIPDVTLLPKEGLIFANLIGFTISVGSRSKDPKALIFGTCSLEIQGVQLRNEFIPLVDKAQILKLSRVTGLKKVLRDRGIGNGFLNLKYLEVTSCDDDLEDLLGEPKLAMQSHGLYPSLSFNKLVVLIIKKCKLKFLFSPITARGFVHLERLEVRSCEIIEAIVGFEVQDDENELILSKLRILSLGDLPNLTSFYAKKEKTQKITGSSSARPQPLFSCKVVLPVLEELSVEELDGIEKIWDKQSPSVNQKAMSFGQLRNMTVTQCKKLMNLVPSDILPRLQNLQTLYVEGCPNVEFVVFRNGKEEEAADDSTLIIPQLRSLSIWNMKKLKSFYSSSTTSNAQSLFNHQVVLPVLEELSVEELDGIEKIWDKQSPSVNQKAMSFGQLRNMTVTQCKKLMNLVPSNILPRLQNLQTLYVEGCPNVEFVVFRNGKEEEAADDSTLIIPQLRSLSILNMKKLKSFYSSSTTSNAQSLFNHQVILPVLEKLSVGKLDGVEEIWDKQSPSVHQMVSFGQLRIMTVRQCKKLMNLVPWNIIPQLQNLLSLYVHGCPNIEFIVFKNGKEEAADDSTLVIPQLRSLFIQNMENLKSFYSSSTTANTQFLFNHQVILPVLEELLIQELDSIEEIWDKQSPSVNEKTTSFSELRIMTIRECKKLMDLVPSNILPRLRNLQNLRVDGCPNVEFVVFKNGKEEKEAADDRTLIIPQLSHLEIRSMEKLKSFYPSSTTSNVQSLFNHQVIFPVLERLSIIGTGNIEIWDKQSIAVFEAQGSFCQLMYMHVQKCNKLMHVFPSKMHPVLKNLQELQVIDCENLEGIVGCEEPDEGGLINEVCFSKLSTRDFQNLPKLVSFCTKLGKAGTTEGNCTIHARPCFIEKVNLPCGSEPEEALEAQPISAIYNIESIEPKKKRVKMKTPSPTVQKEREEKQEEEVEEKDEQRKGQKKGEQQEETPIEVQKIRRASKEPTTQLTPQKRATRSQSKDQTPKKRMLRSQSQEATKKMDKKEDTKKTKIEKMKGKKRVEEEEEDEHERSCVIRKMKTAKSKGQKRKYECQSPIPQKKQKKSKKEKAEDEEEVLGIKKEKAFQYRSNLVSVTRFRKGERFSKVQLKQSLVRNIKAKDEKKSTKMMFENKKLWPLISIADKDVLTHIDDCENGKKGAFVWMNNRTHDTVTLEDMVKLLNDDDIGNTVIDGLCSILANKQEKRERVHGNSFYFTSACWTLIKANENAQSRELLLDSKLKELDYNMQQVGGAHYKYLIFPMNSTGNKKSQDASPYHWTLLVYNVLEEKWIHYNSMLKKGKAQDQYLRDALIVKYYVESFMKKLHAEKKNAQSFNLIQSSTMFEGQHFNAQIMSDKGTPQQARSSVDCGLIVCHIIKELAEDRPVPNTLSRDSIRQFRAELVNVFLHDEPRSWTMD